VASEEKLSHEKTINHVKMRPSQAKYEPFQVGIFFLKMDLQDRLSQIAKKIWGMTQET
jgi:hypothetical protein